MWYWEFNRGSYYTTCFEVEIVGEIDVGDNDDDDDDDSVDNNTNSGSFDNYLIRIPLFYVGANYSETTLLSGANSIELNDSVIFDFTVLDAEGVNTTYGCYMLHLLSLFNFSCLDTINFMWSIIII